MIKRQSPTERDKSVSKRIRARRIELGLTQTAVAERMEISYQALQKIEMGETRASTHRLDQFVQILDAPLSFFLGTSEALDTIADSSVPLIREALAYYQVMGRIKNPALRRQILSLVTMLADGEDDEASP